MFSIHQHSWCSNLKAWNAIKKLDNISFTLTFSTTTMKDKWPFDAVKSLADIKFNHDMIIARFLRMCKHLPHR